MTTPISDVMPYGFTLAPLGTSGTFLDLVPSSAKHVVGTTGLKVPSGVCNLLVDSRFADSLSMQIVYNDGSPLARSVIVQAGGGRYFTTLSGRNINYIQFICTSHVQELAAGRRATVQIIPVPDPM